MTFGPIVIATPAESLTPESLKLRSGAPLRGAPDLIYRAGSLPCRLPKPLRRALPLFEWAQQPQSLVVYTQTIS